MGQYYEAILQVRVVTPELLRSIERHLVQDNHAVANVKKRGKGFDWYLGSRKTAVILAKQLLKQFGGKLTFSKKLHTRNRQTGKLVYRVTILFTPPLFLKGAIVMTEHDVAQVTSSDKVIKGISIISGKKKVLKNPVTLETAQSIVVAVHPAVYILHPHTYQPMESANAVSVRVNDMVEVVLAKGKLYVIPKRT